MTKLQLRRHAEIFERMVARTVVRSELTDLTQSANVRRILSATAREIDDVYFQLTRLSDAWSIRTATGRDLDERAIDIQPGKLRRRASSKAQGLLIFSRASNTGVTITIPVGTSCKNSAGTEFVTTEEAVITNLSAEQISGHGTGRDSNSVAAIAAVAGIAGNTAVGSVTKFLSKPAGISAVTNPSAFVGGESTESDDDFRTRLLDYVASLPRAVETALRAALLGLEDPTPNSGKTIKFVHVFSDPVDRGNVIVYIDDGAGTAKSSVPVIAEEVTAGLTGPGGGAIGGEQFLNLSYSPVDLSESFSLSSSTRGALTQEVDYYMDSSIGQLYFSPALNTGEKVIASYSYYSGLVQEAQKVLLGDITNPIDYPGYAPVGVRTIVTVPTIIAIEVGAQLQVSSGYSRDSVIESVKDAVLTYINTRGISADIIRNDIIQVIMDVDGVLDVALTQPAENVIIYDNEIPRSTSNDLGIV